MQTKSVPATYRGGGHLAPRYIKEGFAGFTCGCHENSLRQGFPSIDHNKGYNMNQ
jgi:hypothetical protein